MILFALILQDIVTVIYGRDGNAEGEKETKEQFTEFLINLAKMDFGIKPQKDNFWGWIF